MEGIIAHFTPSTMAATVVVIVKCIVVCVFVAGFLELCANNAD